MNKPKVLILGKLPPPYIGPAVATEIILNSALQNSFELLHLDTNLNAEVKDFGKAKLSKLSALRAMYKRYASVLKDQKPDVVLLPISQTTLGFAKELPFIRMAHTQGVKVVVHLRGSNFKKWFYHSSAAVQNIVRSHLKKCAGVIVLGESLKNLFTDFFAPDQIFVVQNGNDYSFPARKTTNLHILYLANYLPGKGLYEVLMAMKLLQEKGLEKTVRFEAYGSWDNVEYKKLCQNFVQNNHLEFVRLNAPVKNEQKWQVLADAEIFVFCPVLPEGQPWSIIEAMAANLPVVTTNRGAISEMVANNKNGFVLADPVPELIAESLEKLISDPDLRRKMGSESGSRQREKFSATAMVSAMENCLNSVIYRNKKISVSEGNE